MNLSRRMILITLLTTGCSAGPTDAANDVRVDATVSPTLASPGETVTLTLTAINEGSRTARWSSGCSQDLSFRIVDAAGTLIEEPEFAPCTAEKRELGLQPHATLVRTVPLTLGLALAPGRHYTPGVYRVQGRLGVGDNVPRPGVSAALQLVP